MDDLVDAVDIMTQAFFDDPLWRHLLHDERKRRRMLPEFFRKFLQRGIECGEVYGAGRPLQGVAIWVMDRHGGDWISRPSEAAYMDLLLDPSLTSSSNARTIFSTLDALQLRHAPGPHMYLSSIGVAAEARGSGVASRLIKPFLALADGCSMPIYTETVEASNIPLYEHFHFKIVQTISVPGATLTIWSLLRCPRALAERKMVRGMGFEPMNH